jgi:protein-serine/threonine kinase
VVNPLPTSDETLREHRRKVSQHFSVATDLTMAQYRKLVMQWSRSRSEGRNLNDETEPPLLLGGKPSTRDVFPVGANISSASVKTMFLYNSGVTVNPVSLPATPSAALGDNVRRTADPGAHSLPASTSKARKVMHWFRSQSKGRGLDDESEPSPPLVGKPPVRDAFPVSANIQWVHVAAPSYTSDVEYTSVPLRMYPPHPERTTGTETEGAPAAPSFAELVRRHVAPPPGIIRTHHGAVNQATVTTGVPIEIMRHVRDVLVRMYVEVQIESEYKYRCVRAKRRRRGPPAPSGIGLGLRGDPEISPSPILSPGGQAVAPGELGPEPVYGDPSQDQGDEVRFYVELTKLDGLKDTYSIDIRRLKGNLRSYKFLYDYITQCVLSRCGLTRGR